MKKLFFSIIAVTMLLVLASCDNPLGLDKKVKVTTALTFETILQESRLVVSDADFNLTIRNMDEFIKFQTKYLPHISAMPFSKITNRVDFDTEMLVIVGCKMHPSGSDYIEVKSIYSNGKTITVYAKEVYGGLTTDIGYPIHVVKLKKSDLPVEFAEREIIKKDTEIKDNFPIKFYTLIQGSHDVISEKSFNSVIRTKEEADKFVEKYPTNAYDAAGNLVRMKLPEINFDKEMMLVVHAGVQSSGSNKLAIEKVAMMNGAIHVYSVLTIPEIGTDDIGYPVHIVAIPKYKNEVIFEPTRIERIKTDDDNTDPNKANEFVNTSWQLYSWTNASGETTKFADIQFIKEEPTFTPENYTINFISPMNFFGKAGCNDFKGIYKADNGYMGIGDFGSTKVNCFMSSEYMQGIVGAYKYRFIDKTTLEIVSNDTNMNVMTFKLAR